MTPNPPTDNLYKFVTFLGVALLVFSTWSLGDNLRKMQEARMTSIAETASLDADVIQLSGNVDEISSRIADALSGARTMEKQQDRDRDTLVKMLSTADQLQTETVRAKSEITQIRDRQKELTRINHKSNIVVKSLELQNYFLYLGIAIGAVMSILGFVFWYYLHQRHQDFALRTSLQANQKSE